ncbi:BCCT family transporter [Pseudomonas sp. G11-1]|uniref:Betaine/carnitine transporter, BCCT family n=1 Tax=Halopseudomonas bauzanensis TaxID=653930 RepID=A0A1H9N898_9GAMM|nr:BCCT family transporter [Halopseudomonas bauzanensis]MCO5787934.1 BCCT family transporter [Pseudomonas sp. G11-1]MCO5791108.1 BCCT family transporter [Pseudomonas sp. G11-2]SER32260.1 betaine/carnitine transporter, BCCT family [Halopseudomonas bauzanensis]SFL82940.1 betaine/carnitine transporter, BCCT family [Halopseudomonas bauzanensis]
MGTQPTNETDPNDINPSEDGIPAPSGDANLIDTDYVVGQDNFAGKLTIDLDIHSKVFLISAGTILLFVLLTLALQEQAAEVFTGLRGWLTSNMTWFFISAANIFVLLCVALIVSPLGKVRIGGRDATPDYSYLGWFSMLFAAGMGIGLMFYGVAEPMSHFTAALDGVVVGDDGVRTDWAPLGGAAGNAEEAVRLGMAATIFHWGLHPWAIYAIVALSLAIFSFNKGLPLSVRSIFYPLLGERIWGWPGHVIDVLAVFATMFGLVTSLGLGAQQASAGMEHLFGIPNGNLTMVLLIISITIVALWSVMAGVDKGVQQLSKINLLLAVLLLFFVIAFGPTLDIFKGFFENLGAYVSYLPALSNPIGRDDANFSQGWTGFYWAWWISWSPFVGMFIARVSRGRSVREFLIAVLLVPSLFSVLWMTSFGGVAIDQVLTDNFTGAQDAVLELQLFTMLGELPLSAITSFFGIVLVIMFFITSSDSGSLVIDAITAGGKINAPVSQRIFWAVVEGVLAIALLIGGGLVALQAMAVSTGLPFTVVLLAGCVAMVKGLMSEPR